jgi:hypothetical protein
MKRAWHISSDGFLIQRAMPATPLAIRDVPNTDLLPKPNAKLAYVIEPAVARVIPLLVLIGWGSSEPHLRNAANL